MKFLYKYCSVEGATAIIKNCSFWVKKPSEFNDPFECCPQIKANILDLTKEYISSEETILRLYNETDEFKKQYKTFDSFRNYWLSNKERMYRQACSDKEKTATFAFEVRNLLSEEYLITCFSKNPFSPPMWAHYANNHRGCILAFDFRNEKFYKQLLPVKYLHERPIMDLSDFDGYNYDYLRFVTTKSRQWSYEKEIRLILKNNDFDYSDEHGRHFTKFDKYSLCGIAFGVNIDSEDADKIIKALHSQNIYENVHQAEIELHPFKYDVIAWGSPEVHGQLVWPTFNDIFYELSDEY
jgi:hypothetical protein